MNSLSDRYIKVSAEGQLLPHDATEWEGVYLPAASLIVARRPTAKPLGFKAANAACKKVDLCGAPGERSIALREFVSHLLQDDRTAPSVDTDFFTIDEPYTWIWTCDECAPAGYAWLVNLGCGGSSRGRQGAHNLALAVRAGQFSASGKEA